MLVFSVYIEVHTLYLLYTCTYTPLQMPIMTGLDATMALREWEQRTRRQRQLIVGVSANSEGVMKSECIGMYIRVNDIFV